MGLRRALDEKKRPLPKDRRKMIRTVVDEMASLCARPRKHQLAIVAKKMVEKYPSSLSDMLDNTLIGTGYDSLLNQLLSRVENENRRSAPQPVATYVNQKDGASCSYGCRKNSRESTQDEADEMERQRVILQSMFSQGAPSNEEERLLMVSTYPLQRKDIDSANRTMKQLKQEWPFLFTPSGIFCHFKELVGCDIEEQLRMAFDEKKRQILQLMKYEQTTHKSLAKIICNMSRSSASGTAAECLGVMLLIIAWFNENEDSFIVRKEASYSDYS